MADERDAGDDSTRLTGLGPNDETRFTGVAAVGPAPPAARPDSSIAPGVLLGHTYRIEAMLARGGMGEVYRARHAELETDHAIKIILPELANDQRIVDLFRREASVLRTIRHDAVVSYDGVFRDENGRLYLVMEFADGPSLSKLMRERTFTADEIRQLRDRLADGLAVAHEKGVIHRDISPDNVILPGGQVTQAKIIDFGISKLADPETKTIIGTDFAGKYSYVSPEQLGMYGGQVDGRSDIYSLGLVLVAAAQGEPLDMGQSPISVIEARRAVPDLSRVPEAVRADLAAMLHPDPADRPQSMRALVGTPAQQGGRRGAAVGRERTAPTGPTRLVPILGAAAVLVLLAGGGWYWYEFVRTTDDQVVVTDSGQQGGGTTTSTTSNPDEGSTQAQVTPVVTDQTGTNAAAGGATDAAQTSSSGSSTDATTVTANGDQTGTSGTATTDQSPPIVDAASTDAGATTSTGETSSTATDSGQPTDTQLGLLPQTLDVAKLRDDANRAVQGLSCAGIRIDAAASGDITASGYAGSEADRERIAQLLQGVPNVGRIDNAVVVMTWPLCEALDVLHTRTAHDPAPPLAPVIDPGGTGGVYRLGDHIKVTIKVPPTADGYLYVDSIDAQTQNVIHLLPNYMRSENRVKAGQELVIGTKEDESSTYTVDEKVANNLFIAIFSPKPLFGAGERTIQESAAVYLPALRHSLELAGPDGIVSSSVSVLFNPP